MASATLLEAIVPASSWSRRVAFVLGGTVLLVLGAQISIPLPFTPVPLTGQTFALLLIALLLGSRMAFSSTALYLFGGGLGLPIFAEGTGGWMRLAGSTGGYLWGFLLAAYVVGRLAEQGWDRRLSSCFLAMLVGEILIYLPGLLWLTRFVPAGQVFKFGLFPFIPGDLIKMGLVAAALPIGWKFIRKEGTAS